MELFMEGLLKSGHHIGQEDRSSRSSNSGGSISMSERTRMLDITRDKPIKVAVRVAVPVRDHPKFNFVGKLLGPKGNSMKRLQEETMCKMAVLGRGSMKDRKKEEELRSSGDPRYAHLLDDLHVEISTFAAPAEAHARIAYALAEVRRFLVPDYHDDIRQEQMWEMQTLTTTQNQNEDTNNISNDDIDLHNNINNNNNNNNCTNNNNNNNNDNDNHIDEKLINVNESILNCCNIHNNNNNNALQVELGLANSLTSGVINEVTCNESIMPMQSNDTESQTVTLLETPGALLHPALRGIKTFNIVSLNCNQKAGNTARKRPLLSSPRPMNPTKRTVMTLLARAKNSQVLHAAKMGVGHPVTESMLIASPLVLKQTIDGISHNIPAETTSATTLPKENILQGA